MTNLIDITFRKEAENKQSVLLKEKELIFSITAPGKNFLSKDSLEEKFLKKSFKDLLNKELCTGG